MIFSMALVWLCYGVGTMLVLFGMVRVLFVMVLVKCWFSTGIVLV